MGSLAEMCPVTCTWNTLIVNAIGVLGPNISEEAVGRVGRSIGELMKVTTKFDKHNGILPVSEKLSKRAADKDLERLLKQLHDSRVFRYKKGRRHKHFKKFTTNLARTINSAELKELMDMCLQKLIDQL